MYTIDNFLEIKEEIYNYCVNLTLSKVNKQRQFTNADDLFQDVYLKSYEELPKIKKIIIEKNNYIQIIKNITFWVHYSNFNDKLLKNKIKNKINYYQDSLESEHIFYSSFYYEPEINEKIISNSLFKHYSKSLNREDKQVIILVLKGYNMIEIMEKLNITINNFYLVFERLSQTAIKKSLINELDLMEFKQRITNLRIYNRIIRDNKIWNMYNNGYNHLEISEELNIPVNISRKSVFNIKKQRKITKFNAIQ